MGFNIFTEKEIRKAILNKISPEIQKNKKHWKGKIYCNGKLEKIVKIPNAHTRDFTKGKAQRLAEALGVTADQYNGLISCSFDGSDYYKVLKSSQK